MGFRFLDALIYGIKDVYWNGVAIPTRAAVNFIGGSVADNPTTKTTDVTLPDPVAASAAEDVTVGASAAWLDGGANGATDAQARFDKTINDLKSTSGEGGAGKMGSGAVTDSPHSLGSGAIWSQLAALLGLVNGLENARGTASGIATLDGTGKVPSSQISTAGAIIDIGIATTTAFYSNTTNTFTDVTGATFTLSNALAGDKVVVFWNARYIDPDTSVSQVRSHLAASGLDDGGTIRDTDYGIAADGSSYASTWDIFTLAADHASVTVSLQARCESATFETDVHAGAQILAVLIRP